MLAGHEESVSGRNLRLRMGERGPGLTVRPALGASPMPTGSSRWYSLLSLVVAWSLLGPIACAETTAIPDAADASDTGSAGGRGAGQAGEGGRTADAANGEADAGAARTDAAAEDGDAGPFDGPDGGSDAATEALPSIRVAAASTREGGSETSPLTFLVTLSAPSPREVSVDFVTADGSATAAPGAPLGTDYTSVAGRLTFAPGDTARTVTVAVHGDHVKEGDETLSLELSAPVNATIETPSTLGTIVDDDAEPTVAIGGALVVEGNVGAAKARFAVTLSAPTALPVAVRYRTVDQTAAAGADFTAVTDGIVAFAPGETAQDITIDVLGDTVAEGIETFAVELTLATGATLGVARGVGTIQDDDGVTLPSVSIGAQRIVERSAGRWLTPIPVTLSAPAPAPVTIQYATRAGTAESAPGPGADFEAAVGTLTFAAGEAAKEILVPIIGDALDEPDETFVLAITGATGAIVRTPEALMTIADDDAPPSVDVADVSITEGQAGTQTVTFTLSLSAPSGQTVTVGFATEDGSANAAGAPVAGGQDYVAVRGAVQFPPRTTTAQVAVEVAGDTVPEDDETFTLVLEGSPTATLGLHPRGIATIRDDDPAPILVSKSVATAEGNAGLRQVDVRVRLIDIWGAPRASGRIVEVSYATEAQTAEAGVDYVQTSGTLRFLPGEVEKTIPLQVVGDTIIEGEQSFLVRFAAPVNATLQTTSVQVDILDEDSLLPALTIAPARVTEGNVGTRNLDFVVSLSQALAEPVSVTCATQGRSAEGGLDYSDRSEVLTFAPGETQKIFRVAVLGDTLYEGPEEHFVALLSQATSNVAIQVGSAEGTIVEDDPPPLLSVTDAVTVEGDPTPESTVRYVAVLVVLDRPSALPIFMSVKTLAGTAVATGSAETGGSDYRPIDGSLPFAPGETVKRILVGIHPDTAKESTEFFFVSLSSVYGARVNGALARVTIVDDD